MLGRNNSGRLIIAKNRFAENGLVFALQKPQGLGLSRENGLQQPPRPIARPGARSKSFRGSAIPTELKISSPFILKNLRDGTPLALVKARRSGAQRGASENNFGQRFSVSTPCFCLLVRRSSLPPSQSREAAKEESTAKSRGLAFLEKPKRPRRLQVLKLRPAPPVPAHPLPRSAAVLQPHAVSGARHRTPRAPCPLSG